MISNLIYGPFEIFRTFVNQGHERSVRAKKNIIASFGIKAIGLIISFIKVPILLSYLEIEKYGVWLTIASIVDWANYFDLGIGHGLRNKFAIALANNEKGKAKKLVSTAYFYISIIFIGLSVIIIPLIFVFNWQKILNVNSISNNELILSGLIVFVMFIARFVFNLITMILKADQRPALADIFLPVGSILTLGLISILSVFSKDSLFLACVAISVPPTLTVLFGNFIFFRKRYNVYKPSLNSVDKSLMKDIFSLGIKFFIIQIGMLVMFSSSNIILAQVVNPVEVTLFNIARQYYGLPFMLFGIVLTPIWSSITDAYERNELEWIKRVMKKLLLISVFFSFAVIFLLLFSDIVIMYWLGKKVTISLSISVTMAILNIFYLFIAPYSQFISGVGKLNLGLWFVIGKAILFIPVAVVLTHHLETAGLVIALIIINSLPSSIIEITQYKKIIAKKANGIWNR